MIKKIIFILLWTFSFSVFAESPKTLTVVLDWFINPDHAPLFVADQEGFFAKRGITVKLVTPRDSTEGEKMVAAGRADIALASQPYLVDHVIAGLPIVRFGTLIGQTLNCLIVIEGRGIKSLKDLKGKRIGSSSLESQKLIFSTMLQSANLTLKDLKIVHVGFNLILSLLTGRIDGFMGGVRNFEPIAIEHAGKTPRVFYPENYGVPEYEELILIANKNKVHDQVYLEFAKALREGITYLLKHPQASWEKFASLHPDLNNPLNKEAWFKTLPYFARDPLKLNQKRYEEFTKFLWKKGAIKYLPKIENYAIELK